MIAKMVYLDSDTVLLFVYKSVKVEFGMVDLL